MCKDVFTPFPYYNQSNHKMHSTNSVKLFFCLATISLLDFEVNLSYIYAKKLHLDYTQYSPDRVSLKFSQGVI